MLANKPQLRTINTGGQIDLNVAAQLAGVSASQLKALNPALKRGMTSPQGPYNLLVPVEYADTLELAWPICPSVNVPVACAPIRSPVVIRCHGSPRITG